MVILKNLIIILLILPWVSYYCLVGDLNLFVFSLLVCLMQLNYKFVFKICLFYFKIQITLLINNIFIIKTDIVMFVF